MLDNKYPRGYLLSIDGADAPDPEIPTVQTWTYYHGARVARITAGTCLTSQPEAAIQYAGSRGEVAQVVVRLDGLTVREVQVDEAAGWGPGSWPGDTEGERAALEAEGVDAIEYRDCAPDGAEIDCFRLISSRAVAACEVAVTYPADEAAAEWC